VGTHDAYDRPQHARAKKFQTERVQVRNHKTNPLMSMTNEMQRNSSQFENDPTLIFGSPMRASMPLRRMPLAKGFEKHNAGRDGNVE
jgi:hypothetical protein